jgi:hypothetical protein
MVKEANVLETERDTGSLGIGCDDQLLSVKCGSTLHYGKPVRLMLVAQECRGPEVNPPGDETAPAVPLASASALLATATTHYSF